MSTGTHENKAGTITLADEDAVKQVLVQTVFGLWDIVNNLTRLRPSRHERYRVTIVRHEGVKDQAQGLIRNAMPRER